MGQICPVCQVHEPQVQCITADFGPAKKAGDVVAVKLRCGHVVGGPEIEKYRARVNKLAADRLLELQKLDEKYKKEVAAAWIEVSAGKGASK